MNLKELIEKRAGIFRTMQALIDKAKAEQRELTTAEAAVYDSLEQDYDGMAEPIERARRHEARVSDGTKPRHRRWGARRHERAAPGANRAENRPR